MLINAYDCYNINEGTKMVLVMNTVIEVREKHNGVPSYDGQNYNEFDNVYDLPL